MNKIFIVSEYVHAAQNSTGYFWSSLLGRIALCHERVAAIYPLLEEQIPLAPRIEGLGFRSRGMSKKSLSRRALGQIFLCFGFSRKMLETVRRGDVVLSGTNPAFLLAVIPILKPILRFRWCLLVHDVFPENLVPAGILKNNSLIYRALRFVFNFVYSRADKIVVIGRDMEAIFKEKLGAGADVSVIYNWVSENDVTPAAKESSEIINSLGWQEKVVFQFFGNMGRVQDIPNILQAISLVSDERAAFLFIGDGVDAPHVYEFAAQNPSINIHCYGPIAQDKKNMGLTACDVSFITLAQGMMGLGVPSKAYFSLAANRPLLAVMERDAEVSRMVRDDSVGWICEPGDPVALAGLIDSICNEDLSLHRSRPRQIFLEKYSESVALDKFSLVLDSIMETDK